MNFKLLFSFAAGLLAATTISGSVYFIDAAGHASNKQSIKSPSESEMKDKLASAGYVIHTEEEWNELQSSGKEETKQKVGEVKNPAKEEAEKIVYRTFLTVSEGMTSIDVGQLLVKAKIIANANTFFNEVEKKGVANKLRPGTYEVDSDMTSDEIIATIFK